MDNSPTLDNMASSSGASKRKKQAGILAGTSRELVAPPCNNLKEYALAYQKWKAQKQGDEPPLDIDAGDPDPRTTTLNTGSETFRQYGTTPLNLVVEKYRCDFPKFWVHDLFPSEGYRLDPYDERVVVKAGLQIKGHISFCGYRLSDTKKDKEFHSVLMGTFGFNTADELRTFAEGIGTYHATHPLKISFTGAFHSRFRVCVTRDLEKKAPFRFFSLLLLRFSGAISRNVLGNLSKRPLVFFFWKILENFGLF